MPRTFEHLSEADLRLLASVAGEALESSWLARLRSEEGLLERLLVDPELIRILFGRGEAEAFLHASPFLVFAVLVQRTALDLRTLRYVEEWAGPGQRVPVFDVTTVRDLADTAARRLFLAELLASYTRVASGTIVVRTAHGLRRRRFSELDPARLAELAQVAPPADRPAIQRRLGDLSLFLSGIFPDHAGRQLGSLEQIGRRAYSAAARASSGTTASLLEDVSERFAAARRFLNLLTDRYLFPIRERWFPV